MLHKELTDNIKKVLNSADLIYKNEDYTSATILYFKVLFMVLDFIILKNTGATPKDHTERFRILEDKFPILYTLLDKYFKIYRSTYSASIDKKTCGEIKENVNKTIKEFKIEV